MLRWLRLARMLGILGLCGVACGGCGGTHPMNLVVITLDTLRADHLGCYGYTEPTSPVLDRLAESALLFEQAIAQSAVTPVSHASIFTGLDPYRHGLRSLHGGEGYALPEEVSTLAELMRANGYATGGFVSAFTATRHFGLHQGFETWDEDFTQHGGKGLVDESGIVDTGPAQRRGDETTDRALEWLRGTESPFFQWIHYFDVHDPLLLPPREILERFPPAGPTEEDRLRAIYDAEIVWMDRQVGRVLEALDERGLRERTVVVVLADHGEGLGDHNWWGHSLLFQEQVRIPLLLSVPGEGWSGRIEPLVRTIDLVPTLVDILELECEATSCDFDGTSLRPLIEEGAGKDRIAYSESLNDLAAYEDSPLQDHTLFAINDGRFKLIDHYEERQRVASFLFDLETDPGEKKNLVDVYPDVQERLQDVLASLGSVVERPPMKPLDASTRERLQSLGYVD